MRYLALILISASALAQPVVNFKVVSLNGANIPAWVYTTKGTIQITDSLGHVTTYAATIAKATGITEITQPSFFELNQNYPNPFNPSTTLVYDLAARSHVRLEVFDLLGQKVSTLVDRDQEPGHYAVGFDASALASGPYYCRLTAGDFSATRKLMLFR